MGWAVFVLAILARALYWLSQNDFVPHQYLFNDSFLYDYSARMITEGRMTEALSQMSLPLRKIYLAFLVGCYSITGYQVWLPKLIQVILGSIGCVLLAKIAAKVWNKYAGWIAGLTAAFYGIFIFYDLELLKPGLANFFLITTFYLLIVARERLGAWTILLSALSLSISVLLRGQILVMAPAIAIWILIYWQRGKRTRSLFTAVIFIILIFVLPKAINASLSLWLPKSAGFSTMGGIHFYIGNHEKAHGSYANLKNVRSDPQGHYYDAKRLAAAESGRALTDREVDRFWYQKAWRFIVQHPSEWLAIEFKKLRMIVNYLEIPNDENYPYIRKNSWFLRLPLLSFGIICPLALLGIILQARSARDNVILLMLSFGAYLLILLLTFVTSAYRMPLQPFMILFASSAVVSIIEMLKDRKMTHLIASMACLALFCYMTYYKPVLPEALFDKKAEEKAKYLKTVKGREAEALLQFYNKSDSH